MVLTQLTQFVTFTKFFFLLFFFFKAILYGRSKIIETSARVAGTVPDKMEGMAKPVCLATVRQMWASLSFLSPFSPRRYIRLWKTAKKILLATNWNSLSDISSFHHILWPFDSEIKSIAIKINLTQRVFSFSSFFFLFNFTVKQRLVSTIVLSVLERKIHV